MKKFDKLGRKIPQFDRKAAGKKAAATRIKNDGEDIFSEMGKTERKTTSRGYFGTLKDNGQDDVLKELSQAGGNASAAKKQIDE